MKANGWPGLIALALVLASTPVRAAITKTVHPDAATREFVFVENNADDNFFVTPGGALDPRITGSNRWTGLKYSGTGATYQQSLGYLDDGYNTVLSANAQFDMWLEGAPITSPLLGLRCINWYAGCDLTTSLVVPQTRDASGFYGVTVPAGGVKWMHGMLSDAFYHYLQQMAVGDTLSMQINTCQTRHGYNALRGERCKNQPQGQWTARTVTHRKAANLKLINTHSLAEVFINSDGVPTLGEGNSSCRPQTIGTLSGLSCKMVSYSLQTERLSNTSIHVFPAITHAGLASAVSMYDMQFSLDGSRWQPVNGSAYYFTFNDMKGKEAIYVFFSSRFFKQMVKQGISDINTRDLFNFRFQNTTSPESGWYEFSTSNTLMIKPRQFSISIISDRYAAMPSLRGEVGSGQPALDFGYIVTTSGKTAADEVMIKVSGPAHRIAGRSYCLFRSADGASEVPFPATLSYITRRGDTVSWDAGCDDSWRNMTDALWLNTPWNDLSGERGQLNKTTVHFVIAMADAISLRTITQQNWFGEVSASGEIHVKATWRNVR
ncbi:hypothetical protein [Pantoea sp. 1.19]|uniref:fimbrial adhesin EcpD n=1 Tax=Pantoea sp. 1.19 TaxID=1925589 RepID=UPI00094912DA|nr:hypothetical protein [Pantoea sp. 1.19]